MVRMKSPLLFVIGPSDFRNHPHNNSARRRCSTLNFHAKAGFHYQVQSATSLGDWSAAAIPEITGDDADHAVPLPAGSEGTTFFRVVVNP
jgi:hypothetical protein